MDVLALLKFIIRVELKSNSAADNQIITMANEKDIFDSLFVESVDLYDTDEVTVRKNHLVNLTQDSTLLFSNLGLDGKLVVDLYEKVQVRNFATHGIDHNRYEEHDYVQGELQNVRAVVNELSREKYTWIR
jgi:hypothetical protein